jgi:hypothetical protein
MLIIVAAQQQNPELDQLLAAYDSAHSRDQQEAVAQQIYAIAGPSIQGMIRRAAGARKLNEDQLDALAWQALMQGLSQCGIIRFRRADGVWETFVERCRQSGFGPGARVWSLLTPQRRSVLEHPYLKATTADALVRELNALIRRRDFYDPNAWAGVPLTDEARQLLVRGLDKLPSSELARFNALALVAAFPEITLPPAPPRNLFGYISSFVIPKMKPTIWETADGKRVDEYLVEVYNAVRPDIEAVQRMKSEGTLPDEWARLSPAERIYAHQKARLAKRYGPVIRWWNQQVQALHPGNPFQVDDHDSLRAAKELFTQHGKELPDSLWKSPASRYFLPVAALYPYGIRSITRMLDEQVRHGRASVPEHAPAPIAPAVQAPAWAQLLAGRQQDVYALVVQRVFSGSQHDIERSMGLFLAHNPRQSSQQVTAFLQTLPPDAAELIQEEGWPTIARQIDRVVLDEIRKPVTQAWLARSLGLPQAAVVASVLSIRKCVFARRAQGGEGHGLAPARGDFKSASIPTWAIIIRPVA